MLQLLERFSHVRDIHIKAFTKEKIYEPAEWNIVIFFRLQIYICISKKQI